MKLTELKATVQAKELRIGGLNRVIRIRNEKSKQNNKFRNILRRVEMELGGRAFT